MLRLKPARMTEWTVKCSGSNIDLKVKETGQTFRFHSALKARSLAGFLTVASKPYREEVRVFSRGSGCEVVNVVDLEKYLDGLVNSEFSAEWSQESIEAQVIAARTYALFQIQQARRSAGSTYDLDASVKDQVYDGFIKEDFRASRAVEKTRGLVLMAQNSTKHWQVLKAFYHSTCGGMTELPQNVWGKALTGFNHRVRCAFCGSSPRYEWETRYTSDQLKQALLQGAQRDGVPRTWPRDAYSTIRSGSLVAMSLNGESRDPNSRVDTIDLLWKRADRGGFQEHIRISAALFRSWVSPLKIRSTLFRVQPEIQKNSSLQFVFSGRGNGHGVGMCQWGAKVMGEKGYRYPQILAYYYPGTKLQRFW
jgi:stage II sporulation protein D